MQAKTYQAPTMAMALGEVKKDLGPSALILRTRHFRQGKVLGLFGGKKMWEVRAAPHCDAVADTFVSPFFHSNADQVPSEPVEHLRDGASAVPVEAPVSTAMVEPFEKKQADHESLVRKMTEVHRMVSSLLSVRPPSHAEQMPVELAIYHQQLLDQDVDKEIADQVIDQLKSSTVGLAIPGEDVLRSRLTDIITRRVNVGPSFEDADESDKPRLICLVGPTGVGKTTTIAKLAADLKIHHNKSVGLITIDTYRIAAVDQLKTYADIIGVDLQAVLTPGELHTAIHRLQDRDVILIDTAGRSQNDEMKLNELRTFIDAARCNEVHLVVSAASSQKVAKAAVRKFSPLNPNRIIISKLDEAETFGMILNLAVATEAAVSYVTTGQDVPDDISPAKADVLAECVMRGSMHEG